MYLISIQWSHPFSHDLSSLGHSFRNAILHEPLALINQDRDIAKEERKHSLTGLLTDMSSFHFLVIPHSIIFRRVLAAKAAGTTLRSSRYQMKFHLWWGGECVRKREAPRRARARREGGRLMFGQSATTTVSYYQRCWPADNGVAAGMDRCRRGQL